MNLKFWLLLAILIPVQIISASTFASDTIKTPSKQDVIITFIKHGSLMLTYNNQTIQIDPVSAYADYGTFPKADFIFVTHEHADHLDAKAIQALTKENTLLVLNASSQQKLEKGKVMKNGDKLKISKNLTVEAVPAYNTTPGREKFHPRHRDNGYVLTLNGLRIYIAGDTEDIPEMKKLKNIDIAFLPVNQPYTMTVVQAANAASIIQPKIMYPYHFGNTDIKELADALKHSGIDVRIRAME